MTRSRGSCLAVALALALPGAARADDPHLAALTGRLPAAVGLTTPVQVQAGRHVATVTSTSHSVYYGSVYLASVRRRLGEAAVAGVLLHELGHLRRGQPSLGQRPDARAELAADEEAGCGLARLGLPAAPYLSAIARSTSHGPAQASDAGRRAATLRGHRACAAGADLDRSQPVPVTAADTTSAAALALANSGLGEMVTALKAQARYRLSTPYTAPAPR